MSTTTTTKTPESLKRLVKFRLLNYYRFMDKQRVFILAREIVKRLLSGSIESVKIMIVGESGAGKSWIALALAEDIARWISFYLKKDLDHTADYFDVQKNVATIDPEAIQQLIVDATKKYNVYIFDDIAFTINNRNFQKKLNKLINAWLSIQRTFQNILIFTCATDAFIDNQARAHQNVYIEVTGPKYPKQGINHAKVFMTTLHPRDINHTVHREYPWIGNSKIKLCRFGRPSKETREYYDPIRKKLADEFTLKTLNEKEEKTNNEAQKPKSDRELLQELLIDNPNLSYTQACNKGFKSSRRTFSNYKSDLHMSSSSLQVSGPIM